MSKFTKIGIVGTGFVGGATKLALTACKDLEIFAYDKDPNKSRNTESISQLSKKSEIIFICVPTPMLQNGRCDISIVQSVLNEIETNCCEFIVIRSSIPPGTMEIFEIEFPYLAGKLIYMPEFLTEANAYQDLINPDRIIIGVEHSTERFHQFVDLIKHMLSANQRFIASSMSSQTFFIVTFKEAEYIKYASNAFLSTKVAFFNEIYEFCKSDNVNFDIVANGVTADKRIGKSHSKVPGPDGKFGFSGHCLPKDLAALISHGTLIGESAYLLRSVWIKNLKLRPEEDWRD